MWALRAPSAAAGYDHKTNHILEGIPDMSPGLLVILLAYILVFCAAVALGTVIAFYTWRKLDGHERKKAGLPPRQA
ncbi:hypothetical protein NQ036_06720 [Brevibacterium sp. 91QC2O2]|uniref:hypothetical protein n=1 Tax=Brevibacterium sp. 91QC2O2 TaxID=2968458 RepID=UPI00211B82EA|nr:hypothetical protein [Brevibacterium sp. 91QC2O2]MCQ9367936.1 hypothetical protein [Brevibacterium sp. 91QC2O2]